MSSRASRAPSRAPAPNSDPRALEKPLTMLLFGMINWMFTWLRPEGPPEPRADGPARGRPVPGWAVAVRPPALRGGPTRAGRAAQAVSASPLLMPAFDVRAIVGAGAAGMMCRHGGPARSQGAADRPRRETRPRRSASRAADAATSPMSIAPPSNFLSRNPHFCRSALARYQPKDFVALVERTASATTRRSSGSCSATAAPPRIIAMLQAECDAGGVAWRMPCAVSSIERRGRGLRTRHDVAARIQRTSLVIATGGLSIPKIGATRDSAIGSRNSSALGMVERRVPRWCR